MAHACIYIFITGLVNPIKNSQCGRPECDDDEAWRIVCICRTYDVHEWAARAAPSRIIFGV